jgi:hypothetical protein
VINQAARGRQHDGGADAEAAVQVADGQRSSAGRCGDFQDALVDVHA